MTPGGKVGINPGEITYTPSKITDFNELLDEQWFC